MSQPPAHHLSEETLEQLAEGLLPAGEQRTAAAHVERCGRCAAQLDAYRSLLAALSELPRFAPSAAFGDAVMARVRVAPAPSPALLRLQRWLPSTRRGWMLLAAAAAVPALPLIGLVVWLLTHPLVSAPALWQWSSLQVRTGMQTLGGALVEWGAQAGVVSWARAGYSLVLALPPGTLVIVVTTLAVAIPLSAWSLVRLVRTPMGSVSYAN